MVASFLNQETEANIHIQNFLPLSLTSLLFIFEDLSISTTMLLSSLTGGCFLVCFIKGTEEKFYTLIAKFLEKLYFPVES